MEFGIEKGEKKSRRESTIQKQHKYHLVLYLKLQSGSTLQIIKDPDDWNNTKKKKHFQVWTGMKDKKRYGPGAEGEKSTKKIDLAAVTGPIFSLMLLHCLNLPQFGVNHSRMKV